MALTMNQKKSFGASGLAEVKVLAKTVRIIFKEDGDTYELPLDTWDKKRASGLYRVTMSKTGDKLVGINPPPLSTSIVRFKEFGSRADGIPQPKIQRGGPRNGKNGTKYMAPDKMMFYAQLEVVSKDMYEGLTIMCSMAYGFEPQPGTPFATVSVDSKRDLEAIEKFLRLTGFDFNKDIPYMPNVLPWLEEELKRPAKIFMVTTNDKGYIDSMSDVPAALLAGLTTTKKKKGKK